MDNELNKTLMSPGDNVVVGVSGGADSVALLVLLNEFKAVRGFHLFVCHLNHQLRGQAADADEAFVRELADGMGLPIYVERQDVRAIQAARGGSLEETARAVRYDFFARAADHFRADKIALAHHRDDQVETVLFNLARGTGIHGLRGIPAIRPLRPGSHICIIRPLLDTPKAELEVFLNNRGLSWRTDETNAQCHATRNVLRHKVLPALADVNPSFREHLLEVSRQASQVEAMLDEQARRIFAAVRPSDEELRIERWRLETLPELVAAEVIRKMLLALGAGLAKITARHLREAVRCTTRLELPGHFHVRCEYGWLILAPTRRGEESREERALALDGICRFGGLELTARMHPFEHEAFAAFVRRKTPFEEWLDADRVRGPLTVRHARPGDRFHPLGAAGSKKVGDFLTDHKAGAAARPAVVVADEVGLVWLVGGRIDERVRIGTDTRTVLSLTSHKIRPATEAGS